MGINRPQNPVRKLVFERATRGAWTSRRPRKYVGLNFFICFFIDGLDEFHGDHLEICHDLVKLSASANIKLCVSSRAWNVFEDAFGQHPSHKLYIHELTKKDIRAYVHDRLTCYPRCRNFVIWESNGGQLIQDVTTKFHGVFLWVYLVTDLLRYGLTNDDSLSDLSRRLASFPSSLERFFDHIVDTVEPFYHEKMAGFLRFTKEAREPLEIIYYELSDREHDNQDYALQMSPKQLTAQDVENMQARMQRRTNASPLSIVLDMDCLSDPNHMTTPRVILPHGEDPNRVYKWVNAGNMTYRNTFRQTAWTLLVSILICQDDEKLTARPNSIFDEYLLGGVIGLFLDYSAETCAINVESVKLFSQSS